MENTRTYRKKAEYSKEVFNVENAETDNGDTEEYIEIEEHEEQNVEMPRDQKKEKKEYVPDDWSNVILCPVYPSESTGEYEISWNSYKANAIGRNVAQEYILKKDPRRHRVRIFNVDYGKKTPVHLLFST
ncbi:hypothetical protein JTB14_016080 [Gonioctena quinquepunctata]|nr:hypothetical protein JTB14_016080 [Gonioctena quinquepunctata]